MWLAACLPACLPLWPTASWWSATTTRRATRTNNILKPITSSGASRLWLFMPQLWHDFIKELATTWRLVAAKRSKLPYRFAGNRTMQHVATYLLIFLCFLRFGVFAFMTFWFFGSAYRHLMWCHPRPFPDNEPCRARGHPWAQTVPRWTIAVRIDRRQSTPNGIPNRAPVAPSRRRRCRDSISSTWRRNFCKANRTEIVVNDWYGKWFLYWLRYILLICVHCGAVITLLQAF